MKSLEHELQCACIQWFRLQYPKLLIFAIPNGGERNIRVAQKLKHEGVVSGVADLCVLVPNKEYHGLFVEMKFGKNKQSPTQKEFQLYSEQAGYKYELCYSLDEFIDKVSAYLQ